MRRFGLVGFPLGHSFSKSYFSDKFEKENVQDAAYENYPLKDIAELPEILRTPGLVGLNVTIPHKTNVLPFLDRLDPAAAHIGAVNTIAVGKETVGYNTDCHGFKESLKPIVPKGTETALVCGTGGAALAVKAALSDLGIRAVALSRNAGKADYSYDALPPEVAKKAKLWINTTPLGMSPHTDAKPNLPYEVLDEGFALYDLVYNPSRTAFTQEAEKVGAKQKTGLEMLHLQAEKAWEIWNA